MSLTRSENPRSIRPMTAALVLLSGLQTVQAESYASLQLGLAYPAVARLTYPGGETAHRDLYPGAAVSAAVGFHLTERVRLEGELGYQTTPLSKFAFALEPHNRRGDARRFSVLGSAYYDLHNPTPFTPYIGGGLGVAWVVIDDAQVRSGATAEAVTERTTVFAYQLGLGASYHLTPEVKLDLGYRYYATAELPLEQADMSHASHNLYAGLRFAF